MLNHLVRLLLLQVFVDQLRQKCLEEPRSDDRPRGYSALTQDHKTEWQQEVRRCAALCLVSWVLFLRGVGVSTRLQPP